MHAYLIQSRNFNKFSHSPALNDFTKTGNDFEKCQEQEKGDGQPVVHMDYNPTLTFISPLYY